MNEKELYRAVILGPTGVGKSQFCNFVQKDLPYKKQSSYIEKFLNKGEIHNRHIIFNKLNYYNRGLIDNYSNKFN